MITDFPDARRKIEILVNTFLKQKFKENAPIFSIAKHKPLHEGDKMGMMRNDGNHSLRELQHAKSGFSLSQEDSPNITSEELINKFNNIAVDLAGQMEQDLFSVLDKSINEGGNIISGNFDSIDEFLLKGMEMILIDFDDDDRTKPVMPMLLTSSTMIEKIKEMELKLTLDEKKVFQEKTETLLDKKYSEYLIDLKSRKIVD